ncbi:hypothetical protein [Teichococcus wenyumeiae]|nr:hypothetical protein [Pseudoroseomonas wenyumeiae]
MEPFDSPDPKKESEGRRWSWPAAAMFIGLCSLLGWLMVLLFLFILTR